MEDESKRSKEGQQALQELSKPIRVPTRIAQIFAFAACMLVFVPYLSFYQIGKEMLSDNPQMEVITQTLTVLLGAFFLRLMLYVVGLTVAHFADLKLRDLLRKKILMHVAHLPLSWIAKRGSGAIRKLVQDDAATVHTLVAHAPVDILMAIGNPLVLLCFAFWLDWRLALISVATIPLYIFFYVYTMRGMNEKTVVMDNKLKAVATTMVEFVSGIAVIRAFGQAGKAHRQYSEAAKSFTVFYRDWCNPLIASASFSFVWVSIPMLLLVNFGLGWLLLGAELDPIKLITTTIVSLVLPDNLITVASILWSYQMAGAAALRVKEGLAECGLTQVDTTSARVPIGQRVEFSHVGYSYDDNQVLHDVSLTLEEKTVTALVGPSGSGKSTLAMLLARFDDPCQGSITIGGVDLRNMAQETLYRQVAFVLQDAQLLSTSIRNNIALGVPDASQEDIERCARIACVHDEIVNLPQGYDTIIGEGVNLSGGQEQRIAIARALLMDCPILIMDEATAMADPESEAEIQRALSSLVKNRTVLVVAHRIGSIQGADQIVVMNQGRIDARGSHEELLTHPHYRKIAQQITDEVNNV